MEFDFRIFVRKGIFGAIGRQCDDWVRRYASEWHYRGVLTKADLAEIDAILDAKNGEREVAGDDLKV